MLAGEQMLDHVESAIDVSTDDDESNKGIYIVYL